MKTRVRLEGDEGRTFATKQGNTGDTLTATLVADGSPYSLGDANWVRFVMDGNEGTVVDRRVDYEPDGSVSVDWSRSDLDEPGMYRARFLVRTGDGVISFPNRQDFVVVIEQ